MTKEKRDNARDMSRRNLLLATTSLAAASALGSAASVQGAFAQAQPAPFGRKLTSLREDDPAQGQLRALRCRR
jgi:hypothetical protein